MMISNNLTLLSQNVNYLQQIAKTNRQTNPLKSALKYKFNAKLQESRANLSNFTMDSIVR